MIHDGERCELPGFDSLEGLQQFGIFQLFEVGLVSCMFFLTDSFQMKVEGHRQQIMIIFSV